MQADQDRRDTGLRPGPAGDVTSCSGTSAVSGSASSSASAPGRMPSVDALRGCTVAAMLLVNNPGNWSHIYPPLKHAAWHGWTITDLIFPFFLFIVGVSLALSLGGKLDRGEGDRRGADRAAMRRGVLMRGLRVLLLGLALNALAWWLLDRPALRWPGVLQRIGLCIALAGVIVTLIRGRRLGAVIAALLVAHAALLIAGGTLVPELDLSSRVDAWIFGPHGYRWDPRTGLGRDPEGLLSTVGALATTLLGVALGSALRAGQAQRVLLAGAVLAAIGWGLDAIGAMPINKALWTPPFVLWTGGLAAMALAISHWLVDVQGWPAVGRPFGVNAIAAYAGSWMGSILLAASGLMPRLYDGVFATLFGRFGPEAQSLSFALATVAVWWLVMVAMDRWKIYLKL